MSATLRSALKLNAKAAGALVAGVEPTSPAAKAGIEPGDVITAVNGHAVASPRELAVAVAALKPGSSTTLDLLRNGSAQTVTAELTTLKATAAAEPSGSDAKPSIGLALAPLTPDARQQFDLPAGAHGAVVAEVRPGSAAEQAGLRAGDVVMGVGDRAVSSPDEAVRAIREARNGAGSLALRVLRDGHSAFVAVEVPKAEQGPDAAPGQASPDEDNAG